jgi:hypothetical protein
MQFLLTYHKYRKNKNDFFIGRVERDVAPLLLSGEKLYDVVSLSDDIIFGFQFSKQKFSSFGLTHNLIKTKYFLGASLLEDQYLTL